MLDEWPQEWWQDWLEQYIREPWTSFPPESAEQEQAKQDQAIQKYKDWLARKNG